MSTTIHSGPFPTPAGADAHRRGSNGRFVRHFLEMVAAMVVGMIVLGMSVRGVMAVTGQSGLLDQVELRALLMATYMTVGMSVWMRHRGHDWRPISEMGGAMYAPFALLLVPFWAGAIADGGVLAGGHLLMLPAMLGVMLLRRDEYSQDHRGHAKGNAALSVDHCGHP